MKRLLLPLLAALALPTAVNADDYKYYLLIYVQGSNWKVPMKSMAVCEDVLSRTLNMENWKISKRGSKPSIGRGICIKNQ